MQVYLEKEDKTIESSAKTVKELLNELKLNPTIVLVARNDELVTEDTKLSDKDKILIYPVISGG